MVTIAAVYLDMISTESGILTISKSFLKYITPKDRLSKQKNLLFISICMLILKKKDFSSMGAKKNKTLSSVDNFHFCFGKIFLNLSIINATFQ